MKKISKQFVASPYLVWAIVFIVVPLFFVLYYSVTDANGNFTFEHILDIVKYKDIMLNSIWLGFIATVISLVISYPLAYIMARSSANVQRTMMILVMLPMWMNLLIRTYSLMILLQDTGIINSVLSFLKLPNVHMINTQGAVVLGMVYNYIPYMLLPLYSIMAKMDTKLLEAARDLGCNGFGVLRRVIFPLSLPGVISGITMVLIPSISTFYISQKLGNGKFFLIGDAIEGQYIANNLHFAAAIAFILMVILLVCMGVVKYFTSKTYGGE